jgi:hypothetical protein
MLEEFLMLILEEEGPDGMLFQQGGAPPHFHNEVTDFLNRKFPEKWIDRGRPIIWPPRSPDLTALDFFFLLGVHQGCCVRATIGYHFAGTCSRIRDAVATVALDLLNAWNETEYRYTCRVPHGALIEHLQNVSHKNFMLFLTGSE